MLNIVTLFLFFGITLGAYAPYYYDLENAQQYFNEFIQKYEKNYDNAKEHRMRFEIFKRNLNKYNEWNDYYQHEKGGHVITRFADQEGHESCLNLSQMRNRKSPIQVKKEFLLNLPDHVDYREKNLVTGVKNQKHCASCYAFAAIANIEGMYAKKTGQLLPLSEQQCIDCITGSCRSGGDPLDVLKGLAEKGGSETEDDYPYEGADGSCRTNKTMIKIKVTEGHEIHTPDVDSLKAALVQNGAPLGITLYVSQSMLSAVGFVILNPNDCNNEDPNHAVLLVGYNTDAASGKTYWIIKNSWGTRLGDKGYYYFDVNSKCSVGKLRTVTSTVESV